MHDWATRDVDTLRALRAGGVHADGAFDALLPPKLRMVSRRFWTPADAALLAARALRRLGARRVVDVGSGVGKFCLLAGSSAPEIQFVGVEHRPYLVDVARHIRRRLGLANVRFDLGDGTQIDWADFDTLYFFNPFMENVFEAADRLDDTVPLSAHRFVRELCAAEGALASARVGTHLVTYYRFGGRIPDSYELLGANLLRPRNWLRVWVKRSDEVSGYYLETDDGVWVARGAALDANPIPAVIRMLRSTAAE